MIVWWMLNAFIQVRTSKKQHWPSEFKFEKYSSWDILLQPIKQKAAMFSLYIVDIKLSTATRNITNEIQTCYNALLPLLNDISRYLYA